MRILVLLNLTTMSFVTMYCKWCHGVWTSKTLHQFTTTKKKLVFAVMGSYMLRRSGVKERTIGATESHFTNWTVCSWGYFIPQVCTLKLEQRSRFCVQIKWMEVRTFSFALFFLGAHLFIFFWHWIREFCLFKTSCTHPLVWTSPRLVLTW